MTARVRRVSLREALHVPAIPAQERRDMPRARISRARIHVAFAFLLSSVTGPALAQYPAGATVQQLPNADDPAELLAQALRTLATEPNNIPALVAAGHNALVLGDPNAAVGFLGRASELAPRDGQVKAGLGSALVQLEKPADALRLFGEASALGVPDADLAEDRGLAYDLSGDNRRAQRDYAVVLAAHPDDDIARRRLALSQGITGDKAGALATLDPLIRRRDIAGWRAQTFVLAMNGDPAGASYITHIMMPQQADRMQPFLVRLATLSPADKARAVHFGEMPQSGSTYTATQLASTGAPATYAPAAAPAPAAKPSRHRTQAAALAPAEDGLESATDTPVPPKRERPMPAPAPRQEVAGPLSPVPPKREAAVAAPAQTVAAVTAAPAPRQEEAPARPAPAAPAPATVAAGVPATGAPAPATAPATVSGRFIGPPAERAPAAAPSGTQVALESTPAPLAATAFGTSVAPVPAAPVPAAGASIAATVPAPSASAPIPEAPPAAVTVQDAAPPPTPAASQPQVLPLPAAAPTGHFDLPHDSAAPHIASPAARSSTPVLHQPAASSRKDKADTAATAADEGRSTAKGRRTAEEAAPKAKGRKAADDSDEDVATAEKKDDKSGAKSATGKSRHASGATRTADSRDADDSAPTRGKAGARKSKAEEAASSDEPARPGRKKGGKTSDRATASDDSDAKGRKGRNGKSDDDTDTTRSGRSGGKESRTARGESKKDKESAVPKVYVQVAGGANKEDMDKAWEGVKKKAPDLMKGHTPSTTPLRATNRLLVGPFKTDEEAQAFVNKMAGKGLSGFTFKSAKGQKVEKVDSGQ
jgi:Flp pilus assembly protein TadD